MSPQFVDFDADGHLDIVAGTFDGSPHVAYGTEQGFKQPVDVLDKNGERILLNQFWNYATKKWDSTNRCDLEGSRENGQCTSAVAMDWDGDGDLDLLLGDHHTGSVYLRRNEGSPGQPAFSAKNQPLLAGGKRLDVPGTVATLRLVDWNGDGLTDLACGSMGDAYGDADGGGVHLFLNTGSKKKTVLAAPLVLVPPSKKGSTDEPERPDSGLYMDFADQDGDGDLDLVVGGYSHWTPKAKPLSAKQQKRVAELKALLDAIDRKLAALDEALFGATDGLDEEAAQRKRTELLKTQQADRVALAKERAPLHEEHEQLEPGPKREAFVWYYENVRGRGSARPGRGTRGR